VCVYDNVQKKAPGLLEVNVPARQVVGHQIQIGIRWIIVEVSRVNDAANDWQNWWGQRAAAQTFPVEAVKPSERKINYFLNFLWMSPTKRRTCAFEFR
jgi:hypothetical protein